MLRRLVALGASGVMLTGIVGPLTPPLARAEDKAGDVASASPNGRVVVTGPAPITTPAGGGLLSGDPSVSGPPLFLPYTPPADTVELVDERGPQSRTLANPDGTFKTEVSDGPINFQDAAGAWQPIDLSLVPDGEGGYTVAANAADIRLDTTDGSIGSIALGGHKVSLSAPGYGSGNLGDDLDSNKVSFTDALGTAAEVWVQPVDIGLEFGASWADGTVSPVVSFIVDPGDLTLALAKDDRTIVFTDAAGKFAGRIDQPIIREGDPDAAPLLDVVSVALTQLGDKTYLLSYTLDATWLADAKRVFPVILDPTWCIGEGAAGCDDNTTSPNSTDTFVFDDDPDSYEIGWTVIRTGYDVRPDDGSVYGKMRSILKFPAVALPDGAVISDTDLQTRIYSLFGNAQGQTVTAYRLTKQLTTQYTWTKFGNAFDTTGGAASTVPASGYMHWDVDAIVKSFYTRRTQDYKPPYGFLLKMASEASGSGEVEYRRYNYGTTAYRPLLTISYTLPKVGIDFDARLGSTYAPSAMVKSQPVKLPIAVENKTGSGHALDKCADGSDTDCWLVGYRWFDGKGTLVAGGDDASLTDLPADIAVGSTSSLFTMTVTPPATTGQYTLRLDLVHRFTNVRGWASDHASPSLYYSRNKKILTSSSTRWTGSSAIERDEFSINVTEGAAGSNTQSVGVASGGQVGIDLATKNLSIDADSGLGFADRLPLSLTYGYDEALAKLCAGYQGILASCGWHTNWDERITGGANQTGYDYTYVGPDGTPAMLDTDDSGQIAGGAPVLVNRSRVTIFDENGGWDGPDAGTTPDIPAVTASSEGISAWSGVYVAKAASNAIFAANSPDKINLNAYRRVKFAIRTTDAAKAAVCFFITNADAGITNRRYCITVGSADWTTTFDQIYDPEPGPIVDVWQGVDVDLYEKVRFDGDFGTSKDDYLVTDVELRASPTPNSGSTYLDGFRFESDETPIVDETNLSSWTNGQSLTSAISTPTSDVRVGSAAIRITPTGTSNPYPECRTSNGCWTQAAGGTWAYPFFDWYWKKAGGTSAAMVFHIHDDRPGAHCNTGTDCTLTYYAGAAPSFTVSGAYNASIRIAPNVPTTWNLVRRNVMEDAQQALNLFDDAGSGGGDDIRVTGYAPVAVDGTALLIDRFSYGNLADVGSVDPTGPDSAGVAGQSDHPNAAGDTTFTYDFSADYADGSRHYFNRDGLLVRIRDRDRQAISLDWTFDTAKAGPTAYTLTAIRAPGDATSSGGVTFNRQFTLTRGTDGSLSTIRFDEDLGSTGTDTSVRAAIFEVNATGDLAKVSPARHAVTSGATGTFCGTRPNSCVEYTYLSGHKLQYVADPRWDGGSGSSDYRLEVGRSGNDPVSILDRSHGNTALLKVLDFSDDRDTTLRYTRALWQDAAAGAAGAALATDVNPDGQILTQYAPRGCTSGDCTTSTNWPATSTQADYRTTDYEYDGLAGVTTVRSYRCSVAALGGCPAGQLITMTRSETNAAAKIDNYADPLAGGRLAWRATADQVFASLRDSAGTNADWYRTEYVYDGSGQIAETIEVRQVEVSNSVDTVKLNSPYGYWRLNETSGAPMADSSGAGRAGTYTVAPTLGGSGALVRDAANKAPTFNGSTQYAKATYAQMGSVTGTFTVEGWIRSTSGTVNQTFVGSRGPSNYGFDVKLCPDTCTGGRGVRFDVGSGTAWLLSMTAPFEWVAGRWYYVAVAVDGTADAATVYVDGQPAGGGPFTTAGTPVLTNSTHDLYIGQTGLASFNEWFAGQIDEIAVYTTALRAADVAAHFRAGRAVATVDTTVQRDNAGRPTETATAFLANPGFEQATNGWALGSGAAISTGTGVSGSASLTLSTTATTQVSQLVPGQTFRLQFASKSSVGTTSVIGKLEYWKSSTGAWVQLGSTPDFTFTNTAWADHAYDITLPMDADGRVRVGFTKSGAGTGSLDDALLVTHWGKVTYDQTAGLALGLPTYTDGLASCAVGPCSIGTVKTGLQYAAGTTNPNYHPAIFPTKTIANYGNGTQGPGLADDVTTQATYDSWGRRLVATDPDGVTATTVYGSGNQTDVSQVRDGLANATVMTYDAVGNQLTTTTPLGRLTSSTFDARNHPLTTTAPDGVVNRTDYDTYGRATASWANYVNGAVESGDGDLTDDLLTVLTYDAFGRVIQQDADCGAAGACTSNGGLDARMATTYDLLDNAVTSTAYATSGGGAGRTTTNRFETYDPPTGTEFGADGPFSRTTASGVLLPIAPSAAPAPYCPDSASVRCNTVATLDLSGRAILTTDAYGIVTRTRYDLDGKPVQVTANYVAGLSGTSDRNVVTLTEYDLAGNPLTTWDPLLRRDERAYDILGRLTAVHHLDSAGTEYLLEQTVYLPSGRVDRTHDGSAWTKSEYDGAGRAVRTLRHYDTTTSNSRTRTDGFEDRTLAGWGTTSGYFTGAGASIGPDDDNHPQAARTGRGRLRIFTSAGSGFTGAYWNLAGPTFLAGHTYRIQADITGWAGYTVRAFFGVDGSGADYAEDTDADTSGTQSLVTSSAWQTLSIEWTPASTTTGAVHFAVRKDAAGSIQMYLDNVRFWDTGAGEADWNIPSTTVYDADGTPIESVLPPGDLATEREFVSATGFDAAGRATAVSANSTISYAAAINATGNIAYWPLDNPGGAALDERGSNDLTVTGPIVRGVAGGPDEAHGGYRFNGTSTYLSTSTLPTTAVDDVHMEAWFRYDAVPTADSMIVAVGTVNTGYGVYVRSTGTLAVLFSGMGTLDTGVVPAAGPWHYVRYERLAGVEKLFLDGTERTLTNTSLVPNTPSGVLTVGRRDSAGSYWYFRGDIDEVAVWSKTTPIADHWATGHKTDAVTNLTTRTSYDALGRALDTWDAAGIRSHATYDRLGNQTETVANYLDGVTTGGTADDDVRSTFAYDVLGELIGYCPAVEVKVGGCAPATPSEVQAWHYGFDALGRQTTTVPPDNTAAVDLTTEELVYETGGRILKTCRYPAGTSCGSTNSRHTDFTYDNLGRALTQKTWDRAAGSDTLKFTKTLTWNADGSPATVNEGSDTLTYVYDTAGRVSQFKRGATVLTGYTYTAGTSTIATRTDGTQGATTFTYDWARRQTVIDPPDAFVAGTVSRTYRLDGLLATQAFPSSITETLAYDAAKRPISIGLGGTDSISQTFDRAGRITSDGRSLTGITGDAGAGTQTFTYDNLSRLTGSTGLAVSRSYQYDLDGNRTQKVEGGTTTTYTYDRADQVKDQTIGITTSTYTYDRYGNLLTSADNLSQATTYAYDEANRLTTINPPTGGQITFTVDPLDRHDLRKVSGSTTDTYQYLDATETAWQTGTGTTSALLDADGTRLAVKTGSTVSWLVFDLHGSVVAMCTSGTSTITDAYRFDGFGQQIDASGSATNPWRYRGLLNIGGGALADALLDMGARDYSPQLGQFTQLDSVQGAAANPLTMNRFLYALANPATLIDPDGHRACMDMGGSCNTSVEVDQEVATRRAAAAKAYGRGGSKWTPLGQEPAKDGYHWVPLGDTGHTLVFDSCAETAGGWFQGDCDQGATGPALLISLLVATGIVGTAGLCAFVVCPAAATAATAVTTSTVVTGITTAVATQVGNAKGALQSASTKIQAFLASLQTRVPPSIRADASHIFRDAPGHIPLDTPAARELLQTAVRTENLAGVVKTAAGEMQVFHRLLDDGRQVWVQVINGVITNGGINEVPK